MRQVSLTFICFENLKNSDFALYFSQELVSYLSAAVSQLVYDLCNGVGERPEVPLKPNGGIKRKCPEDDS